LVGGQAGGDKYIVHNILFKFAVDSKKFYGSDAYAAKVSEALRVSLYVCVLLLFANCKLSSCVLQVAGHELQGLISLFNCDDVGLCMPLMALVDYKGFRLIAMSTLPVNSKTLCYGTCDGGRSIHGGTDALNRRLASVSRTINVKPHYCGTEQNKVCLFVCACVPAGARHQNRPAC
jgi:hypothetical protein